MIGLIVYFAEIADGLKWAGGIVACLFGLASIPLHVEARPTNRFRVAGFWCVLVALLGLGAASLIPSSESVYKIAGVSSQEKARIDALGNVKP